MKRNLLFEECLAKVSPEIMEEVSLNIDIANRIYDLLKMKKMTQREFAALMGKRESEISRWLTGAHGFTTATLSKIASVLGEPIVEVHKKSEPQYVFFGFGKYCSENIDNNTNVGSINDEIRISYLNN